MKNPILEIQEKISAIKQKIKDYYPGRLSSEDYENNTDKYQSALEYKWWKEEQEELIKDLKSKLTTEQLDIYLSFK